MEILQSELFACFERSDPTISQQIDCFWAEQLSNWNKSFRPTQYIANSVFPAAFPYKYSEIPLKVLKNATVSLYMS